MKNCPNCQAEVEEHFNLCWNCNYSFTELEIVAILEQQKKGSREIDCLRCKIPMAFSGNYNFYEGPIIQILQNRESFDIYTCPKCGKAEFFSPQ